MSIVVVIFALLTLGAAVFMPWAELGLPPGPLEPVRQSLMGMFSGVQNSPNFNFYVYSLFLGLALIAAAIAHNLIGREDSEEKTVLPVKK